MSGHRFRLRLFISLLTISTVFQPEQCPGFPADSLHVKLVGGVDTPGRATGVEVFQSNAFVADADGGLRIISVLDPEGPVELSSHPTQGSAWDVEVADSLVFVADYNGGIVSFDVSDPLEPIELDALPTTGFSEEIVLLGQHLFVADNLGGLRVVDVSDPGNLVELIHVPTEGFAHGIALDTARTLPDSAYVHLSVGTSGLIVFSVFHPESPLEIGRFDTEGYARDVSVSADIAAVADGSRGLRIIDILDRTEPREIGSHPAEEAREVVVEDTLAYSANGSYGIEVVSIADPLRPELRGYYDTPDEALDLCTEGSFIFVANGFEGLMILQYLDGTGIGGKDEAKSTSPRSWHISQNYPNPFNPQTSITLTVGGPEGVPREVNLNIYDVRGRFVGSIVNTLLPPGVYRFTWDGMDSRGVYVPSGIYFAACRVGPETVTRRMLLAR